MPLSLFAEWQQNLPIIALVYARILPIFMLLPIINTSVISSNFVRHAVIFIIIVGIWPAIIDKDFSLPELNYFNYFALVIKEALVGATIGFTLALPFWIFNAMGAYIDVARGASMGNLIDPTNGQESTESANFINFCVCIVYFQLGGFRLLLETLVSSYHQIGLIQGFKINPASFFTFLPKIMEQGFILASPVLLMLLLTEALLGVLSRFTPQLNAFSVSLTVKTFLAFFVLSLYFWQSLPDRLDSFMGESTHLIMLNGSSQ